MSTILFRQSGGPIGDMFFTINYMYHQKQKGNKVIAAIPTDLNQEMRALYNHFNFIDEIIELPFFLDDKKFLDFCKSIDYEPCRFLIELDYLKGINFYPMNLWFKEYAQPTIDTKGCVGFQVASSANYDRPKIPHLSSYIVQVIEAGFKPIFFGTKKDEELFIKNYPMPSKMYREDDSSWRFGKDTLLQTISNIKNLYGHIVFSSGTCPIAAFQGVPVLELWGSDQFQFYAPFAHYMMGNPIHHLTQSYDVYPSRNLIKAIFPKLKDYCLKLYGV